LASFLALSLALLLRRLSGALVQPLGGVAIVVAGAACGAAAGVVRWIVWCLETPGSVRIRRTAAELPHAPVVEPSTEYSVLSTSRLPRAATDVSVCTGILITLFSLPGLASILLLTALTLPGTSARAIFGAWFLLLTGEAASWLVFYGVLKKAGVPWREPAAPQLAQHGAADETPEAEVPAGLMQRITRVREGGRESIHALVSGDVPRGDRLTVIHIAFCPPLDAAPELTAHVIDADDAEVRITQAETFGTRIEVRLSKAAEEGRNVVVEVLGRVIDRQSD
jgi:hypothetical protein